MFFSFYLFSKGKQKKERKREENRSEQRKYNLIPPNFCYHWPQNLGCFLSIMHAFPARLHWIHLRIVYSYVDMHARILSYVHIHTYSLMLTLVFCLHNNYSNGWNCENKMVKQTVEKGINGKSERERGEFEETSYACVDKYWIYLNPDCCSLLELLGSLLNNWTKLNEWPNSI